MKNLYTELSIFIIIISIPVFVITCLFVGKPTPKQVVIKQPINLTNTGKSIGKGVGRVGIGFIKGIFTSGDGK
jgi:hypothetical protein